MRGNGGQGWEGAADWGQSWWSVDKTWLPTESQLEPDGPSSGRDDQNEPISLLNPPDTQGSCPSNREDASSVNRTRPYMPPRHRRKPSRGRESTWAGPTFHSCAPSIWCLVNCSHKNTPRKGMGEAGLHLELFSFINKGTFFC